MVGSLGGVDGAAVADLFAGSGALGLEALSRGARSALFVERDRRAAGIISANASALGLDGPGVRVVQGDVLAHLGTAAGADVVFADPPYAFAGWPDLLAGLAVRGFAGLAVLEAGEEVETAPGWDVLKVRRYGGTVVMLARVSDASHPTPARPLLDADQGGAETDPTRRTRDE
jgi:16S rRNA (guanine(966)-N(2))-methyltransferase RsmD